MNKQKYIHIKRKVSRNNYTGNSGKKPKHRPMCIEDYEKLPSKEPLKSKSYRYHDYYYSTTYLDFDSVIGKYLKEKIGVCFDDIYTDLISKTKPKHRYLLDDTLDWFLTKVVYYEKEVPYSTKYWRHGDNVIFGHFYLDRDRKVRYFETKNELIIYARNKYRQKKLERILDEKINNDKFDDVVQFNDILTDNCGEIRFDSRIQWFYNRYNKNKHTNCV